MPPRERQHRRFGLDSETEDGDRRLELLLPRLLAGRSEISSVETDEILSNVMANVTLGSRRRRWAVGLSVLAASGAALALALFLSTGSNESVMTTKGSERPIAQLRAYCEGSCTRGSVMGFDLGGTTGFTHFAVFARRPDGTVIWYLPDTEDALSVPLVEALEGGRLRRAAVLGSDYQRGHYLLCGVFSRHALHRSDIREALEPREALIEAGTNLDLGTMRIVVTEFDVL